MGLERESDVYIFDRKEWTIDYSTSLRDFYNPNFEPRVLQSRLHIAYRRKLPQALPHPCGLIVHILQYGALQVTSFGHSLVK